MIIFINLFIKIASIAYHHIPRPFAACSMPARGSLPVSLNRQASADHARRARSRRWAATFCTSARENPFKTPCTTSAAVHRIFRHCAKVMAQTFLQSRSTQPHFSSRFTSRSAARSYRNHGATNRVSDNLEDAPMQALVNIFHLHLDRDIIERARGEGLARKSNVTVCTLYESYSDAVLTLPRNRRLCYLPKRVLFR